MKAALSGDYHYIVNLTTGVRELFNWKEDPAESQDLSGQGLEVEGRLGLAIDDLLETSEIPDGLK